MVTADDFGDKWLRQTVLQGYDNTLFRQKIRSRFIRSFLYYIPYAVLSAMTIPAVFYATGDMTTSIIGAAVAVVLAYLKLPLIVVALAASAAALIAGIII